MLIGMWVSPLISPPITAQHNGVFDKIQCRKIEVIDKDGETTILVEDGGVFVGGKNGGIVFMSTDEHGGIVLVRGKDGGIASMSTGEHGGIVGVTGKDSKVSGSAEITNDEHGGRFDVYNNQGKPRAAMGINEFGTGAVSTWDENGYRQ